MGNICLLLGAGVSVEQGFPVWKELVEHIARNLDINMAVTNDTVIESVGVIENTILERIQKKFPNIEIDKQKQWARQQIAMAVRTVMKSILIKQKSDDIVNKSKLMREIIECVHERVKKQTMTTIISYNFDDYFEYLYKYMYNEEYNEQVKSYSLSYPHHLPSGLEKNLVNIYHVHGRIKVFDELFGHEKEKISREEYKMKYCETYEKDAQSGLIFSGNDYSMLMDKNIVGWTNMVQYLYYSQLDLCIVGFSMNDINFRLLLRRMNISGEKLKNLTFFMGYKKMTPVVRQKLQTNQQTIKYLLHDICSNTTINQCTFNKLPKALSVHLKTYI